MPRVKIDYVVSFSSEDPEHPASNLLLREVSKKKWLCKKGETTCSVVLQLPRSVKITGVHIGAYHAALVEVLVGRSENSEQFQVLVPSSVFISREESRRDSPVVRVRSFGADALSAGAREQRWDRVRLVCSQPHNKHAQFGLSFVHLDEAEGAAVAPAAARLLALDLPSSDEEDFRPGELFAAHRQSAGEPNTSASTGAQIRQATSQALKNISESSTKLMKTPISKPVARRAHLPSSSHSSHDTHSSHSSHSSRTRDQLLYAREDAEPHARIDRVIARQQQHNTDKTLESHQKSKDDVKTKDDTKTKKDIKTKDDSETKNNAKTKHEPQIKNKSELKTEPKRTPRTNDSESPPRASRSDKHTTDHNQEARKRRRSDSQGQSGTYDRSRDRPASSDTECIGGALTPGPVRPVSSLLRGAALVLSGYQNPERAQLRELALELGARVLRDWGPGATHLICAFPNTPKLRALRACSAAPAARAGWLRAVRARRRVLPWRWFATEPALRVSPPKDDDPPTDDDPPPPADHASPADDDPPADDPPLPTDHASPADQTPPPDARQTHQDPDTGDDTDDEIEKVLQAQKKRRLASSCSEDDVSTDEEGPAPLGPRPAAGALPQLFAGRTFALRAAPRQAAHMARYVRAYGGHVREMSELEDGCEVDYIVHGRSNAEAGSRHESHVPHVPHEARESHVPHEAHESHARHVSAAWLARCHDARALLPHDQH